MKIKLVLVPLALLFFISTHAQTITVLTDAVSYNDFVIRQQDNIGADIRALVEVVNDVTSTKDDAYKALRKLQATIAGSIANLEGLQTLEPDFGFKDKSIILFKFYKKISENSYVEMVDELYSDAPDVDKIERIQIEIETEEAPLDDAFLGAQKKFAAHHGITLY